MHEQVLRVSSVYSGGVSVLVVAPNADWLAAITNTTLAQTQTQEVN